MNLLVLQYYLCTFFLLVYEKLKIKSRLLIESILVIKYCFIHFRNLLVDDVYWLIFYLSFALI